MKRQSILLVTSRFPYPLIGGGLIRAFNLLQQFNRVFDVTLLSLGNASKSEIDELRKASGITNIICVNHSPLQGLQGSFKALFSNKPLQVGYYSSRELEVEIQRLIPTVDLCVFHLIRTSASLKTIPNIPTVLEMCDAISANYEQTSREGSWYSPWRIISAIEGARMAEFERDEAKRFDIVSLHTARDAEKVGVEPRKLLVSTQGTNLSALAFTPPASRSGRNIALIGRMDFFPNWHGAQWFAENVLPLLPNDINLKVIGDCSSKIRQRLERFERVQVTGKVNKLDSACDDCFAGIAPMHVATGIQNKVLEYFAMGLPAVVSPSVAAGLLPEAIGGYLSATTPSEWVTAINSIGSSTGAGDELSQHAKRYVESHHSWNEIGDLYNARLLELLSDASYSRVQ